MDTRQAARVARAETRSKLSNSMVMESLAVSLDNFQKSGEGCAGNFISVTKKIDADPWSDVKGFSFFA